MIWLIITLTAYLLVLWYTKVKFCRIRARKPKLRAVVMDYRKHKVSMRNDYSTLLYPYVKLLPGDDRLYRVKYASSWRKPFRVGEEIDVFWQGESLAYWDAYNRGIAKYLPGK